MPGRHGREFTRTDWQEEPLRELLASRSPRHTTSSSTGTGAVAAPPPAFEESGAQGAGIPELAPDDSGIDAPPVPASSHLGAGSLVPSAVAGLKIRTPARRRSSWTR